MSTDDHTASNRLPFEILSIGRRIAVAVNSAPHLHAENLEVVANHKFRVRLGMDMALHRALHIVFGFRSCRPPFTVDVLNAVVFDALAPIPIRA